MSGCNGCCGSCGSCGNVGGCMELTLCEIEMLQTLAQIPFFPVARKMGDKALRERIKAGKVTRVDVTSGWQNWLSAKPMTAYGWRWKAMQSWESWI